MASEEKINELRQFINRVPVLRLFIDQTPDLKWTLASSLTAEEITDILRLKPDPVLYKTIPGGFGGHDQDVICCDVECAEALIKIITSGNNGIEEKN